eukprot:g2091.t1
MRSSFFRRTFSTVENLPHWRLNGRCVIVTGGTKGIGKSCVEELLNRGARVVTGSSTERSVNDMKAHLSTLPQGDENVRVIQSDMTNANDIAKLIDAARDFSEDSNNSIHGIVNNVGINVRKPFDAYTEEEYQRVFNANLHSAFQVLRAAKPHLSNNSSVVNISSICGSSAVNTGVVYAMTKGAMNQMTRFLACELGPKTRVNTVSPGFIETPLTVERINDPVFAKRVADRVPLQRHGQPREIGALVAFLMMEAASYLNGQDILVDGGMCINSFGFDQSIE